MKTRLIISVFLLLFLHPACRTGATGNPVSTEMSSSSKVEVYYFHLTHRCATCNAIEAVTREVVEGLNNDRVVFNSYNLEEADGKAKAATLKVSSQTLLLCCGDEQRNLTNEAFLNARSNPDKLKALLEKEIKGMLE